MPEKETHVVMAVITDKPETVMKTLETFATMAAGFAMDGVEVNISTHQYECTCDEEHNDA